MVYRRRLLYMYPAYFLAISNSLICLCALQSCNASYSTCDTMSSHKSRGCASHAISTHATSRRPRFVAWHTPRGGMAQISMLNLPCVPAYTVNSSKRTELPLVVLYMFCMRIVWLSLAEKSTPGPRLYFRSQSRLQTPVWERDPSLGTRSHSEKKTPVSSPDPSLGARPQSGNEIPF